MKSRLQLALLLAAVAAPSVASAHIQLVKPTPRINSPTGSEQKAEHCGSVGYSRAAHPERVSYFKPGETIKVMWQETVPHSGWYRIAFQPNGEVFHVPPPGTGLDLNNQPANYPTVNMTGMTDTATGTVILLDRIADGNVGTTMMADVTLPNVECNNCTLQFTQFMLSGGPTSYNINSIYFNCADIVISNSPPPTTPPDAGPVEPTPDGGSDPVDRDLKGSCSIGTASSASGVGALILVGLLVVRRRKSRHVR
jgi:MYXO-CTERM domain-containing protein